MIKLVNNTIEKDDITALITWLWDFPHLTKGDLTLKFEEEWSKWLGCKYSVFVNSGSSANLLMLYAAKVMNRLKNDKIVVPAVSWATTVAPVIQLGLHPILCECDRNTLGIDVKHLEEICEKENPASLLLVHVLGFPCDMEKIIEICLRYDVQLLEDSCESMGSSIDGIKTGNFGHMGSFSTYFGHIISSVEGGIVSTNDLESYNCLKMLRSHGWDRDLSDAEKNTLKTKFDIDEFKSLYTFYVPGFNLRATDIQAFLGLRQLKKLDSFIQKRKENYSIYNSLIDNSFWKPEPIGDCVNFAYPIITPKIRQLTAELQKNNIETRPLICGSVGQQPFWTVRYGITNLPFADVVHEFGLYLPNNHEITKEEIVFICNVVNNVIN